LWKNPPHRNCKHEPQLELPETATVRVSPQWLRRAFDILVDNAVDAVKDCDVQVITIGTRAASGGAEIFVSDTGPGIPDEVAAKLGLEPIVKADEDGGMGMGLLMAHAIVQTCGGRIRLGSTGPDGTTMIIWLPCDAGGGA
jgi:signal transduction histidine kinase